MTTSQTKKVYEGYMWRDRFEKGGEASPFGKVWYPAGLVMNKAHMVNGKKKDILRVRVTVEVIDEKVGR